jgi:ferredoxin
MRITIDRTECTGCGACWNDCPEVFEENSDDETAQIVKAYRVNSALDKGEVNEDMEEQVQDAADGCPVEVIRIED